MADVRPRSVDPDAANVYDDMVEGERLRNEVVRTAKRQMHLNNHGVGLGPDGWHNPNECNLCDALRALDEHNQAMAAR